jgi:hypothetical protein
MESFLQEKTAAWAEARPLLTTLYAKYFGEPLSRQADRFMPRDAVRTVIEDVKQSDGTASVVARDHFEKADIRTRYRLAAAGESWKIVGIDHECFCRGKVQFGSSRCPKCGGEGWFELGRDSD